MTRVEKYRKYRAEIASMNAEENSTKNTVSHLVDEMKTKNDTNKLSYDDVMKSIDVLLDCNVNNKKTKKYRLRRDQIVYRTFAILFLSAIIIAIIITSIILWR